MTIKKQLYIIVIIFFAQIFKTSAQTNIGLDAGITYNKLDFKSNNSNLILTSRQGYIINLNIDHSLNKWFILETSPGVLQKNYSIKNRNDIYQNINNTYLQFPISMKYDMKLIKRLNVSGSLGGYYAYWIKSTMNGTAPNVFEITSDSDGGELIGLENIKSNHSFSNQDNRSEFGWVAKIGLHYRIINNLSFSITGQYYRSITDQQKNTVELQVPKHNQTSALTIGVSYSFNKSKGR